MSKQALQNLLPDLSSDSDASPSPSPKKKPASINFADLEKHGYSGGPSVLLIKPPDDSEPNWAWSSGADQKGQPIHESIDDREKTRKAITGAEAAAKRALETSRQSQVLRDQEKRDQKAKLHAENVVLNQVKRAIKRQKKQEAEEEDDTNGRVQIEET